MRMDQGIEVLFSSFSRGIHLFYVIVLVKILNLILHFAFFFKLSFSSMSSSF